MIPAATNSAAVPPPDPVATALEDAGLRDSLLKHALAVLRCPHQADDACQDTYKRAWQKRGDYDPQYPAAPWLHGILHHVLRERFRSLRTAPTQPPANPAAWDELAEALDSDAGRVVPMRLDAAAILARLTAEQRQIMDWRFVGGLTHSEIGDRLRISEANARVRLCRALRAAKEIAGTASRKERP